MAEVPSGLMSEWYMALYDENCVRVLDLLREHPQLLKEGIPDEPKRMMEGRVRKKGPSKRRTALHVGARRGCLALVKLVVDTVHTNDGMVWSEPMIDELLIGKDGEFELDALAMAVVNGNLEMVQILLRCSLKMCKTNPYGISRRWDRHSTGTPTDTNPRTASISREHSPLTTASVSRENSIFTTGSLSRENSFGDAREQLRKITRDVMESHPGSLWLLRFYKENLEFNFLPWDEYLFHFTFTSGDSYEWFDDDDLEQVRRGIFEGTNSCSPSLQLFLCDLQDGQGRTALHVAVDEGTVKHFLRLIPKDREASSPGNFLPFLDSLDGMGRTPLHRAAALSNPQSLRDLLGDDRINVNANFSGWEYAETLITDMGVDLGLVSRRNGFGAFGWFDFHDVTSALDIAILHRKRQNVQLLLSDKRNARVEFCRVVRELQGGKAIRLALGPLQLAALVGDASILELLLKDKTTSDPGRASPILQVQCSSSNPRAAIHLAAAAGRFDMLTLMMGKQNYDPFVIDIDGNTALHHAVNGREFEFDTHLLDHINCKHACDSRQLIRKGNVSIERQQTNLLKGYVERQGCIELLLQFGFDIWRTNKAGELPYPGSDSPAEFLSWWFNRWTKETIASQKTLNAAANAISVTAILVATASYMGPFQPPLGYDEDTSHMQIRNSLTKVYLFCETMAFYLAVAAVMLSLMTSLPLPQESMLDELKRTRQRVIMAVGFLFPAIIFFLLDFATASIIVVPQGHAAVPKSTVFLGGFICLLVIFLFLIRLVRLVFYKNARIRRFSRTTPLL